VRRAAAVLVVGLALAGCGGGVETGTAEPTSDEDSIRQLIDNAYNAFASGDAAAFCSHLTADYRADFEENYGPCEDATLDELNANLTEKGKQQLENPEVGQDLKIKGTEAYPDVNGDGLELVKEGDEWKLDDFDLPDS
jgi:hypothetical protein